ncbi:MAG: N-acetylmuramoyl-L-alanine amidase [Desulfobacteraceae bacterium]|nr:N-acetylmuramoyl-L-alanine amidase [Desulfobacteraceae bacterium]
MISRGVVPALLVCFLMVFWSCASIGTTPNQLYFSAESCYQELKDNPERQKYRSYWLDCIRKFETVHDQDTDGPWAPAGLFMAGKLYREMYEHSYAPSDLKKARSIFRQVVKNYPSSAYNRRARAALDRIGDDGKADADEAGEKYFSAESCYQKLKNSPERQKYRRYWLDCIREFEKVYETDPQGPWAAAGLFMTAELYHGLYAHSYRPEDRQKANSILRKIVEEYPSSAYSRRAMQKIEEIEGDGRIRKAMTEETTSGEVTTDTAADTPAHKEGEPVTVTGIRYWSNPDYTRVVIDANQETDFTNNLLNKDPSINKMHERLYVDLENSRLGNDIERKIPIDDSLLKDVRAAQHDRDTVRVVVDIKSFENYNIFSLKNPFRIVIDVRGEETVVAQKEEKESPGAPEDEKGVSIAQQLALGVRRIVIDPGHGGKDYGAPGAVRGVHEKHVVLDMAKKLAEQLRQELNCEVLLTRSDDTYLTLEERTAIANTKKADLFISLHANASTNQNARGLETYFLNLTTDKESIAVAARENATSEKNISELQTILDDLMRNAKVNESSRLATYVQKSMYSSLKRRYGTVNNKGVRQAPFYVLLGAQMPSILIETGFISNRTECRRLCDTQYQREICRGIVSGVKRYIQEIRPTAFFETAGSDRTTGN